jgi:hypothetical protein
MLPARACPAAAPVTFASAPAPLVVHVAVSETGCTPAALAVSFAATLAPSTAGEARRKTTVPLTATPGTSRSPCNVSRDPER